MPAKPSRRSNVLQLPAARARQETASPRVAMGWLAAIEEDGTLQVRLKGGSRSTCPARTTVALEPSHVGREVTLLLEDGDLMPIITGLVLGRSEQPSSGSRSIKLDGERLVLSADREIVLRCGEASITLTRDGKVVVKGANLVQTATGLNRIRGASVQIN
ncbi:DUF6484 domain-containing protein [Cystobacter fuscus]|nr:DUF6484 domain-containing protein [Cystobacter fuscus]